ncbi:PAS domain S-box protein [Methanolobus sp. ZRKC2]|uniref:PAS domain-containing sensor histidine kinase n=1 Tax=Methanolobus sp. ZRKC2 TaxID=3125783 RepID=UPI00324E2489
MVEQCPYPSNAKYPVAKKTTKFYEDKIKHLTRELEKKNKQLRIRQEFYEERLENLNDVLFAVDNEGKFTYLNSAIENLTEYKKEEVLGTPFTNYVHPEDLPRLIKEIEKTIHGAKEPYMFRIIKKSGNIGYVHTSSRPIIRDSKVVGINGLMVDIKKLKQVESNLKEERDLAQKYLDVVAVIIFVIDREGNINLINRKGYEVLGFKEDEVLSSNWFDIYSPEHSREKEKANYRKVMNGELNLPEHFESSIQMVDKEIRTFQWHNILLKDENGNIKGLLTSGEDITERKKAEKTLIMAKLIAENAHRTKREFISTISHELRTPLNHIIGYSKLLHEDDSALLSNEQKKYARVITGSGDTLLKMVNSMIDLCEIENGTLEIDKKEFLLPAVIDEIESFMAPIAKQKDINLSFDINTESNAIYSDEEKFRTILYNITHNAIKFTPPGGTVNVKVYSPDRKLLRIAITDSGIGISKEELSKLFKPFCQADSSLNRKFNGTGLGLSLAKEFVEMLGGKIQVESEPEKGSTFSFTIPAAP